MHKITQAWLNLQEDKVQSAAEVIVAADIQLVRTTVG